jgi:hypothetical protein
MQQEREREMCGGRLQTKQVIRDDTADRCDGQSKRQPTVAKAKRWLRSLAAKHLFHSQNACAAAARARLKMKMNFLRFASREFLRAGGFPPPAPLSRSENEAESKLINYENGARGEANALHSAASLRPLVFSFASRSLSPAFIFLLLIHAQGDYRSSALCSFFLALCLMILAAQIPSFIVVLESYTQAVFLPPDAIVI